MSYIALMDIACNPRAISQGKQLAPIVSRFACRCCLRQDRCVVPAPMLINGQAAMALLVAH